MAGDAFSCASGASKRTLSFRPGTHIFISTQPTDMRKGFDGLSAIDDGSLFCAMRPEGESHMWQSRSSDRGKTWTRPTPLPFFGHCANLLHTRSGVTLLGHRDTGMTIHHSRDQAKTWAGAVMIDPCGGAYSQMVELPDGHVLIVYYTEGRHSEIRAQRLRVDEQGVSLAPWPEGAVLARRVHSP